ncbi:MAG: hypothetical protein HY939_02650 [Gammaproteobacteria bacterium]|nr:hypothetical protein [Gammaproteobacteria bacterium]
MYETEIEFLEKTMDTRISWETRPALKQIVSSLLPEKQAYALLERILNLDASQEQATPFAFLAHSHCQIGSRVVISVKTLQRMMIKTEIPFIKKCFEKKRPNGTMHRLTFFGPY